MAGVNKIILIGNVGRDPEQKFLQDGTELCAFDLATSHKPKGGNEVVEWHHCIFFKEAAKVLGEHLTKGAKLYVEGSLRTRKWEDRDGNPRQRTEIIGQHFQFLSAKREGNGAPDQRDQVPPGEDVPF